MDLKVYKKELVKQPSGNVFVYVPSVIDIIPVFNPAETSSEDPREEDLIDEGALAEAETLEGNDELEQACALATIWQRGLDPLDEFDGNRWSQLYLGEINVINIMEDLNKSVQNVSPSVNISFDTVKDANGNSFFTYNIKVVA